MDYVTRADERAVQLRGATAQREPVGIVGGLVAGMDRGQPWIVTGIVMGPVRISVEVREKQPDAIAVGWQDVVEISCEVTGGAVVAAGPYVDPPGEHFAINLPGGRWFRLRVHARHRDVGFDQVASTAVEEYMLVAWPTDTPTASAVLAVGSQVATSLIATASRSAQRWQGRSGTRAAPGFVESPGDASRRAAAEVSLLRRSHRSADER